MLGASAGNSLVVLGGGFVGEAVARGVTRRKSASEVAVVSRHPVGIATARPMESWRVLDVANRLDLYPLLDKADSIVYAIGSPPPAVSASAHDLGLHEALLPLVAALEVCRVSSFGGRFVYLSSGGAVYGEQGQNPITEHALPAPVSAYGVLKQTGEMLVAMYGKQCGFSYNSLRIANAYGPGQPTRGQGAIAAFLEAAWLDNSVALYGDGKTVRDYIYIDDLADVILDFAFGSCDAEVVNVGTGVGTSLLEVLALVEKASGKRLKRLHLKARPVDVKWNVLDVNLLGRICDRTMIGLEEGIQSTWRTRRAS